MAMYPSGAGLARNIDVGSGEAEPTSGLRIHKEVLREFGTSAVRECTNMPIDTFDR